MWLSHDCPSCDAHIPHIEAVNLIYNFPTATGGGVPGVGVRIGHRAVSRMLPKKSKPKFTEASCSCIYCKVKSVYLLPGESPTLPRRRPWPTSGCSSRSYVWSLSPQGSRSPLTAQRCRRLPLSRDLPFIGLVVGGVTALVGYATNSPLTGIGTLVLIISIWMAVLRRPGAGQ